MNDLVQCWLRDKSLIVESIKLLGNCYEWRKTTPVHVLVKGKNLLTKKVSSTGLCPKKVNAAWSHLGSRFVSILQWLEDAGINKSAWVLSSQSWSLHLDSDTPPPQKKKILQECYLCLKWWSIYDWMVIFIGREEKLTDCFALFSPISDFEPIFMELYPHYIWLFSCPDPWNTVYMHLGRQT